jgi:hypothetical protein
MPCRRALVRERCLSSGVRGPVLRETLRWFDSSFQIEVIPIVDLLGCDLLDPGRSRIGLSLAGTDTNFPADGKARRTTSTVLPDRFRPHTAVARCARRLIDLPG